MTVSEVVSELERIYKDQVGYPHPPVPGLTAADVERWARGLEISREAVYDQLALYIARGFHSDQLTFAFCDAVANDLFAAATTLDDYRSDLFWAVYLAFDEGEYYHNNNREEDPVETYTKPMLAQFFKDRPSAL